jgi:hypothetical protein
MSIPIHSHVPGHSRNELTYTKNANVCLKWLLMICVCNILKQYFFKLVVWASYNNWRPVVLLLHNSFVQNIRTYMSTIQCHCCEGWKVCGFPDCTACRWGGCGWFKKEHGAVSMVFCGCLKFKRDFTIFYYVTKDMAIWISVCPTMLGGVKG